MRYSYVSSMVDLVNSNGVNSFNHLEKYESQWEGLFPIYHGEIIRMCETTKQYSIVFPGNNPNV